MRRRPAPWALAFVGWTLIGLQARFVLQHGLLGSYVVELKTLDGFERVALGLGRRGSGQ